MRPIVCLISDRHRDGDLDAARLVDRVAAAARSGITLVQLRERDMDGRALTTLVHRCVDAVRGTPARVVVNDRLDVALAAGAHGVHLRGDSVPAPRVRAIVPSGFLLGRSVHDAAQAGAAARAGGLDYLVFGTTFATASKPGRVPAGIATLRAVIESSSLPVLAVGGIMVNRLAEVAATGAAGFAAIGLFCDASDLGGTMRAVDRAWRSGLVPASDF